jgi:hypothetical protein
MQEALLLVTPDAFGRWLIRVAFVALQAAHPGARMIHLDREDAPELPGDAGDAPVLYTAHYPGPRLMDYLDQRSNGDSPANPMPIVVGVATGLETIIDIMATASTTLDEALRPATASLSMLASYLSRDDCFWLFAPQRAENAMFEPKAGELRRQLLDNLGIPYFADVMDAMRLEAAILAVQREDRAAYAKTVGLDAADIQLLQRVFLPLLEHLTSGTRSLVAWPRDVLITTDQDGGLNSTTVDVTGPARILYYGPYFHLPAGHWLVRVAIGFSNDISDLSFVVAIEAGGLVAHGRVQPMRGGLFKAEFPMLHTRPECGVEVIVRSEAGAIEGKIAVGAVHFLPMQAPAAAPSGQTPRASMLAHSA